LTRRPALVGALLAAGVVALFAANVHRYAFLGDDSFISFRYARHLAEGQGLVWNPGERVEGYTNFLWVLLMAGAIEADLEPELASKVLGIASGLGLLAAMVLFTARTTSWRNPVVWLAPGVLAVHRSFTAWCTGGLETMFFSLLVFLASLAFLVERDRRVASPLGSSMLFALATLTRPEGALFALVAGAFFLGEIARRRSSLRAGLCWAAPYVSLVGAHLLWRHAYYGYWLPNTFYAKVPGAWWEQGFQYLSLFASDYQIVWFLPLVAASVLLRRQLAAWLLFAQAAVYLVYVAWIGGDRFEFRFLVPILPHLTWLMADGVTQIARLRIGPGRPRIPGVVLAGVAALGLLLTTHVAPRSPEARRLRNRVGAHGVNTLAAIRAYASDRAREGRALRRLSDEGVLPPDLVLCVGGAGAVPYYTDWTTVDRRGLNDVTIAHRPLERRGIIAHERDAPYEYLVERKVVVFDVLNRLLHPSYREKRLRRTVVHDGHELPLKAVRIGNQYLVFATVQPDAELDRIFAGLEVLH
jgi:hypothetical protein